MSCWSFKRHALLLTVFLAVALSFLCILFWFASGRPALGQFPVWGILVGFVSYVLLWGGLLGAMRVSGVRLTRWQIAGIAVAVLLSLSYFTLEIHRRQFIYYFDYGHYYQKQIAYENFFGMGLWAGLKNIFVLGAYGASYDYTNYICLFVELPYAFTPKTGDWYTLSCCAVILPPLFTAFAALANKTVSLLGVKRSGLATGLGFLGCASMPLVYRALSYGQPDNIGLIFVIMIFLLTAGYWFERVQWSRWFLLLASVYLLIVCRRWYAYWLVAYTACYAVAWAARLIRSHDRRRCLKTLRNALGFLLPSLGLIVLALWPMLQAIVSYDYALYYAAYSSGGFVPELKSQASWLGWLTCFIFSVGLAWGIANKKGRTLAFANACTFLLSLFLFTRVQNMGAHQSLLLVPSYCVFAILAASAIASLRIAVLRNASVALVSILLTAQLGLNALPGFTTDRPWLARCSLPTPDRDDIPQVEELAHWIAENVYHGEIAYMIPHGSPYNPDVFRNALLPDVETRGKLAYGSAVLGTHSFPTELPEAKYVLTCEPFCPNGHAGKINDAFLDYLDQGAFVAECTFDMGNGYVFTAYRRLLPASRDEVLHYLPYLEEENRQFPEMFEGVLERYLLENGL